VGILKINKFQESLLSICASMAQDSVPPNLEVVDAIRIAACVKSILGELMAPPDGTVAVSFIRFGLLPLLPKELPPIPQRADAFFLYHGTQRSSLSNLCNVVEGEEVSEDENGSRRLSSGSEPENENRFGFDEDIPEVIGLGTNGHKLPNPFTTKTNNNIQNNGNEAAPSTSIGTSFEETFQGALLEAIMSILLNSISILPDEAFRKFLEPNMIAHIFVAYCSHPHSELKGLALQLLAAYLNRVKNPITTEFIKNRGFFLASFYAQGNPELAPLIIQICNGFGPFSYALINGLIYSNQIVSAVLQWIQHVSNNFKRFQVQSIEN